MNWTKIKRSFVDATPTVGFSFLCGMLFALLLTLPETAMLKSKTASYIVTMNLLEQNMLRAADQLAVCAGERTRSSSGNTVLLDLAHYRAMPPGPQPGVTIGSLRLSLADRSGPNAPLWRIPGRVTPRVLNDAPALWGYFDEAGKFQGWHVPEKED
jgi:hypothetical protein